MPSVRCGIEQDILRPPLDAAFEHGLERLVGGVAPLEGEIVAEQNEAVLRRFTEMRQKTRQR